METSNWPERKCRSPHQGGWGNRKNHGRARFRRSQKRPARGGEFQKILDHRGQTGGSPVEALAHLGLGRARAMAGDASAARTAYQDFFAMWKDADPDIPIWKQAKAEYAKLQ